MKSFLLACAAAIIIAVGAGVILHFAQQPYDQAVMGTNAGL
jgi:hypothetical protein